MGARGAGGGGAEGGGRFQGGGGVEGVRAGLDGLKRETIIPKAAARLATANATLSIPMRPWGEGMGGCARGVFARPGKGAAAGVGLGLGG